MKERGDGVFGGECDPNAPLSSKQMFARPEVPRFDVFSDGMREGYGEHWVQATDYDDALAEIERLRTELAEAVYIIAGKDDPHNWARRRDEWEKRNARPAVETTLTPLQDETRAAASGSEVSQIEDAGSPGPLPPHCATCQCPGTF